MSSQINRLKISANIKGKWQTIVDVITELFDVPTTLITKLEDNHLEIIIASNTTDNPYLSGDKESISSNNFFCEIIIKGNDKLFIPNALKDNNWINSPQIDLGLISYLGFPITLPNGKTFGTICIMDTKENYYTSIYISLLKCFRDMVQAELELIYMNELLGLENKTLFDYAEQIETVKSLFTICRKCKKVKDNDGYWMRVDDFFEKNACVELFRETCDNRDSESDSKDDYLMKYDLTPREHDVLQLVLKGKTNKEIGYALNISTYTSRGHVSNIFKKIKVKTRLELVSKIITESQSNHGYNYS